MNGDFSELIEYLDKEFGEVKGDIKELKENFNSLQSSVDAYAVRADTFFQELVMLSHKVDRHKNGFCKLQKNLE